MFRNNAAIVYAPLAAGALLNITAAALYGHFGYSTGVLLVWLLSLGFPFIFLWRRRDAGTENILQKKDIAIALLLVLVCAPVYLAFIYFIPWQVNTDEATILFTAKRLVSVSHPDIFGLSGYWDFPSFIFIIFGWLAKLAGRIDLFHFRIIHALFALSIVFVGYFFFRALSLSRLYATGAATILGFNHSLIAISRMTMRDNSALLVELLALLFLFRGFEKRDMRMHYLGGMFAGLSLYVYNPAKLVVIIWIVFCFGIALFEKSIPRKSLIGFSAVALCGFLFVASPILVAAHKVPASTFSYSRQQILLFPEGRELQREWSHVSTVWQGLKANTENGLLFLVAPIEDYGNIYFNYGHGFTDPATGILAIIGCASLIFMWIKKKQVNNASIFIILGFLGSWGLFTFLLTKNPNYTRLLVLLPFIAYLAVEGIRIVAEKVSPRFIRLFFVYSVVLIVVWNLLIFCHFAQAGLTQETDVRATARYIESRKNISPYSFYLIANKDYLYYSWGEPLYWNVWLDAFTDASQKTQVLAPDKLDTSFDAPFTLFMNRALWEQAQVKLRSRYPSLTLYSVKTDSSLVAVEVR